MNKILFYGCDFGVIDRNILGNAGNTGVDCTLAAVLGATALLSKPLAGESVL